MVGTLVILTSTVRLFFIDANGGRVKRMSYYCRLRTRAWRAFLGRDADPGKAPGIRTYTKSDQHE